jgi:hypothetical protein
MFRNKRASTIVALVVCTTLLIATTTVAHGAALRKTQEQHVEEQQQGQSQKPANPITMNAATLSSLFDLFARVEPDPKSVAVKPTTTPVQHPPQAQLQQQESAINQIISQNFMEEVELERNMIVNRQCNPSPILHTREGDNDEELLQEYQKIFRKVNRKFDVKAAPGTLVEDPKQIMTVLPEGDFILWGYNDKLEVEMSAYNDVTPAIEVPHNDIGHGMKFVDPKERDMSSLRNIMEVQGDHVVFVDRFYNVFAHLLVDFIPYIAYLKDTLPPTTRFLLADAQNRTRSRIQELDPEFAKRVDWIDCPRAACKNNLVRVRNGNLIVFHPVSSTRHMDLLLRARRWILQNHPPKQYQEHHQDSLDTIKHQRTVVYYTRNDASALHGRAINLEQEQIMIQAIHSNLQYYNRTEKLVILDGTQSFAQQIAYFRSANFVIGSHGGGLANLLFTMPSSSCQERPKVLEFLNNPLTPKVQDGSWHRTYYNLYSTCPWVEYHHVLYVPPSDGDVTFVNIGEFRDALKAMFRPVDMNAQPQKETFV